LKSNQDGYGHQIFDYLKGRQDVSEFDNIFYLLAAKFVCVEVTFW